MTVWTTALTKRYGGHVALSGVNLKVPGGCVYGLVGPNGAGKTTLLKLLAGLSHPTGGSIGLDVPRRRVTVLPDTPQFDPWLTGREVVALAAHLSGTKDADRRVGRMLADAGLQEAAGRRVGGYSRGMLQRLGIAANLVGEPELLLLDEPASALDPAGRREVLDLIGGMRGQATVILSSHILADVHEVCDTVGVLRAGNLLYQGPLEHLLVGRAVPAYRVHLRLPSRPVVEALARQAWITSVGEPLPQRLYIEVRSLPDAERHLPAVLGNCGAQVISVVPDAADLEVVFLELTSRACGDWSGCGCGERTDCSLSSACMSSSGGRVGRSADEGSACSDRKILTLAGAARVTVGDSVWGMQKGAGLQVVSGVGEVETLIC